MASYHTWPKKTSLSLYISQSHIVDSNLPHWRADTVKREKHTAKCFWTSIMRLVLLLGTDKYIPPHRIFYVNVFIQNVWNYTTFSWCKGIIWVTWRILLNVYSFQRFVKSNIFESDVVDAIILLVCGNWANCHSDTVCNFKVSYVHVFGTLCKITFLIHRLYSNCIIKIGNFDSSIKTFLP